MILDEFAERLQDVVITNHSQGAYHRGVWRPDVKKETVTRMIVQPTRTADLQFLPEGTQLQDARTFYAKAQLADANDTIVFQGVEFTVIGIKDWSELGLVKHFGVAKRDG